MWAEQLPRYDWDVGVFSCKKPTNPLIFLSFYIRIKKIYLLTQVGFQKWAETHESGHRLQKVCTKLPQIFFETGQIG